MRTMRTSMMVLGRELGPAGTAHAACHGGVVRDQAALEGPRETHGVFEGHRGLQLDIDLQGGGKTRGEDVDMLELRHAIAAGQERQ